LEAENRNPLQTALWQQRSVASNYKDSNQSFIFRQWKKHFN